MAHDHIGGPGMVSCTFEGKITRNNLKAYFIGTGNMKETVNLYGSLWGTLSDTEGRGKYSLSHEHGSSYGEWSLKRIKATK
jgi:hypothetical protein